MTATDADRAKALRLLPFGVAEDGDLYRDAIAAALASERAAAVADLRARVLALTFASDDGSEYEHDHAIGDGYPECPACWAEGIRAAVTDTAGDPA